MQNLDIAIHKYHGIMENMEISKCYKIKTIGQISLIFLWLIYVYLDAVKK